MHRAIASVKGQWIAEHLAAKEYCNLEAQQCFENQLVPTDNQDFFLQMDSSWTTSLCFTSSSFKNLFLQASSMYHSSLAFWMHSSK